MSSCCCLKVDDLGKLKGFFKSGRGLCKGNPLSPFLFAIFMEIFYRFLKMQFQKKMIDFHPKCKKVNISHLFFTTDFMLLSKANEKSV
uniref:Reverse transcriptase domain-containing protein n=1 Tax=Kalanchoe fedtschenkoi TaxID=63787 RepID=A0A7N0UT99_KALFE